MEPIDQAMHHWPGLQGKDTRGAKYAKILGTTEIDYNLLHLLIPGDRVGNGYTDAEVSTANSTKDAERKLTIVATLERRDGVAAVGGGRTRHLEGGTAAHADHVSLATAANKASSVAEKSRTELELTSRRWRAGCGKDRWPEASCG